MERRTPSRRAFLRSIGITGMSLALGACGSPAATPGTGWRTIGATTAPAFAAAKPIVFWVAVERHKVEFESRVAEINKKFNVDLRIELPLVDVITKKLQTTLMVGSGFPDIVEMNAEDVVKFMKGDDAVIPFLALNDALEASPYYRQVLASRWARSTKDGRIYAAPLDIHPMVLLYHDAAWRQFGVDLSSVATWDEFLAACACVDPKMPDGGTRYPIMDTPNNMAVGPRMLEKGFWWTDARGEPTLTDPRFRQVVEDALRFKPYRVDFDWVNQVAMLKSGQVMSLVTPDWMYSGHKYSAEQDRASLASSPMRIMRIPGFTRDDPRTGTWGGMAATILKQSPNKELATEIMLYLCFDNSTGQLVQRYKQTSVLPPLTSVWDDPAFHEPDPYVGGQPAGDVFISAAYALPSYSESWTTNLVSYTWGEQDPLLWTDKISVDQAIQIADADAREKIRKNA